MIISESFYFTNRELFNEWAKHLTYIGIGTTSFDNDLVLNKEYVDTIEIYVKQEDDKEMKYFVALTSYANTVRVFSIDSEE